MKNLVFIARLGSTGSSALCDLIRGYANTYCPSQEWRIWVDPDGLIHLANQLGSETSLFWQTSAIERFRKLVKNLTGRGFGPYCTLNLPAEVRSLYWEILRNIESFPKWDSYPGQWYGNSNRFLIAANRLSWKAHWNNKTMSQVPHSSVAELLKAFGAVMEEALERVLLSHRTNNLALNENFSVLFADAIFEMHPNAKMLVALRNPLDVYADSLRVGWLAMPYEIEQFIVWQNSLFEQVKKAKHQWQDKIHLIWFEDLCNQYEAEMQRLRRFLPSIFDQENTINHFHPDVSSKNIDQWREICPEMEKFRECFFFNSRKSEIIVND